MITAANTALGNRLGAANASELIPWLAGTARLFPYGEATAKLRDN